MRPEFKILSEWLGDIIRAARRKTGWSFVYTTEVIRRDADWVVEQFKSSRNPEQVTEELFIRFCESVRRN